MLLPFTPFSCNYVSAEDIENSEAFEGLSKGFSFGSNLSNLVNGFCIRQVDLDAPGRY
jgi:hypothetical protein